MLRLILGCAGSGKSEFFRKRLRRMAKSGEGRLLLIVPEQASFENERAILRLLGERDARRVLVTSFSRLTGEVQRHCGGFAGRRLDEGGRGIFMSLALEQTEDSLTVFRKSAKSSELTGRMLAASTEFKMCGISPEDLRKTAENLPTGTLRQKAEEIALILAAYDALVAQSYLDPLDDLTRLKNTLLEVPFFAGYTVMIDSFQSFTVQEYDIIELLLKQARRVEIALCTDRLDDPEQGAGLFSVTRRTASNLVRLAKRNSVPVASPAVLKSGRRFHTPALAALEAGAYRPAHRISAVREWKGVSLYEASDVYDEASFVCALIRRLVIQSGYRYRDFLVIARDPENYRGILDDTMSRWEIPHFLDEPQEIDSEPLMRLLLSAFKIIQTGFSSDEIFPYLKTGLAGLTAEQISRLENYVFVWNLTGKQWSSEWTGHPAGFSETFTQRDAGLLAEINGDRRLVLEPLEHLREKTADCDGAGMALAAYEFLSEVKAAKHLREFARRLSETGNPALAERELRLWDLLMEILDQTALVIGQKKIARDRYAELLRLVILSSKIASIPQGLDEVTVGAANRTRAADPKVVFLIGAAQGSFPMTPGDSGIISDEERRDLIRLGLPLNDTASGVAVQERFLAYSSMNAASERLFISYPVSDGAGKAISPSSIIHEVRAVFPDIPLESQLTFDTDLFVSAEAPAFETAARRWNSNDGYTASLKALLRERGLGDRLDAVEHASEKKSARFSDPGNARALFGTNLQLSATQIETYHLCRFQYFCRYGLDARERRVAALDPLEYGSLMHALLQELFRNYGSEALLAMTPEKFRSVIQSSLDSYINSRFGGLADKSSRFGYLVSRVAEAAGTVVLHIARELAQSGFRPEDFELEIGKTLGPLRIPLPDGGEVSVDGKIDRVDLMAADGVRYVRIVDYKTGKKEFRLSDILYGMNLQMLLYLAALCENGEKRYGKTEPAGILYMPASRPSVSAARGTGAEQLEKETSKQLRMDGLLVDSAPVIEGMEPDGNGKYLPVTLKNGVPSGKEHLVSGRELEQILRYLRRLVSGMARELHSGNISAVPISGEYEACGWCPYACICGHERDDPVREMQKENRDAALAEMTRQEEEPT